MQAICYWLALSVRAGGDHNGQKFAPRYAIIPAFFMERNSFSGSINAEIFVNNF
jgi:hypothetical protein